MLNNDRANELLRIAYEEGLRVREVAKTLEPKADDAMRKAERDAYRQWIQKNTPLVPSKLVLTGEVEPPQILSSAAQYMATIARGFGYSCLVCSGTGFNQKSGKVEPTNERFLFFTTRGKKIPDIMVHIDLEKRKDDLQKYVYLRIKIQDFRYKKRSVRFSEDVLRLCLINELCTLDPSINPNDLRKFPLVCTHMTYDTYKERKFEAFHIVLFLECYPSLRQVYFENLDKTLSTICRMMFDALPGFKGSRKPLDPRTKGLTTADVNIDVVELMDIDDSRVVKGVPIDA